jgi:hypothetical protein
VDHDDPGIKRCLTPRALAGVFGFLGLDALSGFRINLVSGVGAGHVFFVLKSAGISRLLSKI